MSTVISNQEIAKVMSKENMMQNSAGINICGIGCVGASL